MTLAILALTLHVISFSGYMVFPPVVLSSTQWWLHKIGRLVLLASERSGYD